MTPTAYPEAAAMRGRVGMVIPAWFAASTAVEQAALLLRTSLAGSPAVVNPVDIVLVVDGSPVTSAAAALVRTELAESWGAPFRLQDHAQNEGKGAALVAGIRELLGPDRSAAPLDWIACRDADGDHFLDDLPHLFRVGQQVSEDCPHTPVCVIGRRANVHAPLGWLRGEFELLLNEVLIEAVTFARALAGCVWDSRYLAARVPDLQSGYKLYNRPAAKLAVAALEAAAHHSPEVEALRVGMEIVPFVAFALADGVFAEAERKTYHDQPVTSYGSADLPRFYGSKLLWALRRCALPGEAAAILLDSALARRPLFHDADGRALMIEMRAQVMGGLGMRGPIPDPLVRRIV